MTIIVAVSNQKGGVAKTTSCFSLGACLAELGWHTLVVDFDPQGHLSLAAGYDPDELESSVVDLLLADRSQFNPQGLILHTAMANLDLMPADLRLATLEQTLTEREGYEFALWRGFQSLAPPQRGEEGPAQSHYDAILIFSPSKQKSPTAEASLLEEEITHAGLPQREEKDPQLSNEMKSASKKTSPTAAEKPTLSEGVLDDIPPSEAVQLQSGEVHSAALESTLPQAIGASLPSSDPPTPVTRNNAHDRMPPIDPFRQSHAIQKKRSKGGWRWIHCGGGDLQPRGFPR